MLTLQDLKDALPVHLKSSATPALLNSVNNAAVDLEEAEAIRTNFISYSSVLADGRFKVQDYLNACTYVSYLLMGHNNQEAYKRTFPQRYQQMSIVGKTTKEISAYVANYNKNKLVNLVREQSLIPSWVLNQDVYQKAIDTQFDLMVNANSEKVRCEAANSILTHLKRPETKKVEIDLGVKDNSGLNELKDMMSALAQKQIDFTPKSP